MIKARFHGLGGQGVVLTAHLLGRAAMKSGLWAQSLPFFTTAMRGGMVTAFARMNTAPIDIHCFIYQPTFLVLFDHRMAGDTEVMAGVDRETVVLINSTEDALSTAKPIGASYGIDAGSIARANLGKPLFSTVMAGAALKVIGDISLDCLFESIQESFEGQPQEANLKVAKMGFDEVHRLGGEES